MQALQSRARELLATLVMIVAVSSESVAQTETRERPTIGVVLSGGGARAMAHVPVLQMLEEERVPVDLIAGTSMGAVVAGLYAAGLTPTEIKAELFATDWQSTLLDRVPRRHLDYRKRKRERDAYASFSINLDGANPSFPGGLFRGQNLYLRFSELVEPVSEIEDFNDLAIPFNAVATDIGRFEKVVLDSGDLARVMLASMSVPVLFEPVRIDGRTLVDGGLTDHTPASVAKQMGADILIIVDISTEPPDPDEVDDIFEIISQLTGAGVAKNIEEQRELIGPDDLMIIPDVQQLSVTDYNRMQGPLAAGIESANQFREQARRFAIDGPLPIELGRQRIQKPAVPTIDRIRIANDSNIADSIIRSRIRQNEGEELDREQLTADLDEIYSLGNFAEATAEVQQIDGEATLVVNVVEDKVPASFVEVGLKFADDFDGESRYGVLLGYRKDELNALGASARVGLQLGTDVGVEATFDQPFGDSGRFFFRPNFLFFEEDLPVNVSAEEFTLGNDFRAGEFRAQTLRGDLGLGRTLSRFGEIESYLFFGNSRLDAKTGGLIIVEEVDGELVSVGVPFPDFQSGIGGAGARIAVDRFNQSAWPTAGFLFEARGERFIDALGADDDFWVSSAKYEHAYELAGFGIVPRFEVGAASGGGTNPNVLFRLGGLQRLSGFPERTLSGRYYYLGVVDVFRRMLQSEALIGIPLYLGGSLEFGGIWNDYDEIDLESSIFAGSIYVGSNTVFGPLYAGYGYSEGGERAIQFYLNRRF